jgi:CheY-like chemotaxis protein
VVARRRPGKHGTVKASVKVAPTTPVRGAVGFPRGFGARRYRRAVRILVVEDEVELAEAVAVGLRREGYAVDVAHDGVGAVDRLSVSAYDLVTLDLNLPDVDGLELARRLRFAHPQTRVILMSAYHLTRAQLERAQVGEIGFLPKPYAFEQLQVQLADCTAALEAIPTSMAVGL